METETVTPFLSLVATASRMGAILHYPRAEALLLRDHAPPVQPPSRTQTMYRVEAVKMQTKQKIAKEIPGTKR
jgi:hypothetical protein